MLQQDLSSTVDRPPSADDVDRQAPTPEMIDIGGRRLALTRAGRGGPVVILETGLGAESGEWAPIQRALASRATVCFYDRANRGKSHSAPGPRSARAMVDDLAKLLDAAALPAPYVLVGHSFGALIARLFASDRPNQVRGVVLVDSFHEDQFEVFGSTFPPPTPADPPEVQRVRSFWQAGWRSPESTVERIDFPTSIREGRQVSLGNVPLCILIAGTYLHIPMVPEPARAPLQRRWEGLQMDLLRLSTRATHRLVPESGHFVQRDAPAVVVAAIESMLEPTAP